MRKTDGEDLRSPGAKLLDKTLLQLGFKGNAELSRLADVSEGLLWKWRSGAATPTAKNLRKVVAVIMNMAEAVGVYVDPLEFYIQFGIISRDEVEGRRTPEPYGKLVQLDRMAGEIDPDAQSVLREHVSILIETTIQKLKNRGKFNPREGRQAS